jgi:hypothetical protein
MDVIEFRIATEDGGGEVEPSLTIHPIVNGTPLRDLAKVVEQACADAEGIPSIAGGYMGPVQVDWLRWPARHYLGEPRDTWFDDGDTVLLGCVCGESGCWPLTAFVDVAGDTVTWREFRTGHRDWDLSELGPFTFERDQYESALQATARVP